MRKHMIDSPSAGTDIAVGHEAGEDRPWLDIERVATVEVSSEDQRFPVESVFRTGDQTGWRAAEEGAQTLRLIFDEPTTLHRLHLRFIETEIERTQQFTLRWSGSTGGAMLEIVRQQWTFSPGGSTEETETYSVDLAGVAVLELSIRPDLQAGRGTATLSQWRVA